MTITLFTWIWYTSSQKRCVKREKGETGAYNGRSVFLIDPDDPQKDGLILR